MDLLRFLLRLPFTLIKGVCWAVGKIFWLLGRILRPVVGNVQWRAPDWASKSARGITRGFSRLETGVNRHPISVAVAVALVALLAVGGFYGYHAWLNRPQPIEPAPLVYQETTARVSGPQLINYAAQNRPPQEIILYFNHAAAPITLVGKTVEKGSLFLRQWKANGHGAMPRLWCSPPSQRCRSARRIKSNSIRRRYWLRKSKSARRNTAPTCRRLTIN